MPRKEMISLVVWNGWGINQKIGSIWDFLDMKTRLHNANEGNDILSCLEWLGINQKIGSIWDFLDMKTRLHNAKEGNDILSCLERHSRKDNQVRKYDETKLKIL